MNKFLNKKVLKVVALVTGMAMDVVLVSKVIRLKAKNAVNEQKLACASGCVDIMDEIYKRQRQEIKNLKAELAEAKKSKKRGA